jgi:sulfite reductase alpha subunit-like flavoprotein
MSTYPKQVLEDFPSVELSLADALQIVRRIRPRAFSISSSNLVHPTRAHLTVAVVDFKTPYNRPRIGLCSNYLANLNVGAPVFVGIHKVQLWVCSVHAQNFQSFLLSLLVFREPLNCPKMFQSLW